MTKICQICGKEKSTSKCKLCQCSACGAVKDISGSRCAACKEKRLLQDREKRTANKLLICEICKVNLTGKGFCPECQCNNCGNPAIDSRCDHCKDIENATNKKRYEWRLAESKCVDCEGIKQTDSVRCNTCLSNRLDQEIIRTFNHKNDEVCRCGSKLDRKGVYCQKCVAYQNSKHLELRNKRRSDNLCPRCGDFRYYPRIHCRKCTILTSEEIKENKLKVFEHYGHKCNCCGEETFEFLTIDHINRDGAEHRRKLAGKSVYRWLIRNKFPGGFQIYCYNCNCVSYRELDGVCPHQKYKSNIRCSQLISKKRLMIIDHYGNNCNCCGETIKEFLTVDHVNKDGAAHRRELKQKGIHLFTWVIDNNFPDSIQVLCYNCNCASFRTESGICPHKF